MPGFTDYKPTTSDHVLPNEETKSLFQYKRFLHWSTSQVSSQGLGRVGKGSWHIQILSPGDEVLFEQKVTISITVIFAGFSLIWYYYDGGEVIETAKVAGNDITESSPAWSYTLGNTEMSEFGTLLPGGGVTAGSLETGYMIDADWESPVYKMTIPKGCKLNVITDHWGLGVPTRPEWRFRFGGDVEDFIDSTFDDFGYLYSVNRITDSLTTLQGMVSYPNHIARAPVSALIGANPSIVVDRTGKVLMVTNIDGVWRLYESQDSMITWQERESELLKESVEMAHLVALRGGGYVMITKNGDQFQFVREGNDGSRSTGVIDVDTSVKELSASQDKAGVIWVISDKGETVAQSVDDGVIFT